MGTATISVAMATYNGERYIGEQLASIARQRRRPDELVVVDDASSDATVEIVEAFRDDAPFAVEIHRNPVRLGWRDNFFAAMARCRHDLIALCDQDDVWHEDKLARCAGWFERRSDLALLVHSGRVVTEDLRPTRKRWPPIRRTRVLAPGAAPMGFRHHGMALVFPRWLIEVVDPADRPPSLVREESVFMNHDLWLCLVGPTAGSVALLGDELLSYRRHDTTASNLKPTPIGGPTGWRGLLDVPAKEVEYEVIAARRRAMADYLEALGTRRDELPSGQVGFRVERQVRAHRREADALDRRADVIRRSSPRRRRIGALARLLASGGYGRRGRGGLGPSRIALDLSLALTTRPTRPVTTRPG